MKYIKQIKRHLIGGLLEIDLDPFYDDRGEIWSIYEDCELFPKFVEDKVTISTKGVLRGLHGDGETSKLISCLSGEIFFSVVDYREDSPTFKSHINFILEATSPKVVFVPAGCLNGHLCLSERCVFFYKWSSKYTGPSDQVTIKWDDPTLDIPWPICNPILSERDKQGQAA